MSIGEPEIAVHDNALVALVDVLGARTEDANRAKVIVEKLVEVRGRLADRVCMDAQEVRGWTSALGGRLSDPELRILGDAIALLWPLPDSPSPKGLVIQFAEWVKGLFLEALSERLPLRGAVAYGSLILNEAVALGSAVSDAAEWYEEPDWIGVVATPRCGLVIDMIASGPRGRDYVARHFVPYGVPLKEKRHEHLWTLSWPMPSCACLRQTTVRRLAPGC